MSVISASLQLNKGFRQHWLPQKLEGGGLLARFNLMSHSPKFVHVALQVSVQVNSQPVSVRVSSEQIGERKK